MSDKNHLISNEPPLATGPNIQHVCQAHDMCIQSQITVKHNPENDHHHAAQRNSPSTWEICFSIKSCDIFEGFSMNTYHTVTLGSRLVQLTIKQLISHPFHSKTNLWIVCALSTMSINPNKPLMNQTCLMRTVIINRRLFANPKWKDMRIQIKNLSPAQLSELFLSRKVCS